jgi:hypothetical protein
MSFLRRHVHWLALAMLSGAIWLLTGCKTTDDASNDASRPWNAPKTWEHGLPSGMWERR